MTARQPTLDHLLGQRYGEEYRAPAHSPTPPSPPPQPHPHGCVGDGRHGAHHHHQHGELWVLPLIVERASAPLQVAPPHPAPVRRPRPLCCSFCWKRAARWAREDGVPVPSKNARGSWSTHSLKGPGPNRVVTCPVLRQVVCGHCGATGDHAHTTHHHETHPEEFD
ncbi:hypothetical protein CAEBREN_24382 [Caenorhabditis brenneri]|uniref:Nanos-type domain-containing protein n=1 Tax=Caenorhabditis brenneri TaxID=135651 RepID=G0MQ25_CAEBE|nr:hypothetical protein CAEBREN_24382 [Caenorhabditis brenneri]